MGLLTPSGLLIAKHGLSVRADSGQGEASPAPTVQPNTAAGEGRTLPHQALERFPPQELYAMHQREALVSMSPDLPRQTVWGFDGMAPGPTYVGHYGRPALVRNFNDLPLDNRGFGFPSVTTHLHNGHTPSESDGFPCNFFETGQFYDMHFPNVMAGFDSTHPPDGDINESLSTLFYHDHRADFTAQNTYKGLTGFYLLFNEFDTGDEATGFHLPSFPQFDIPMTLADKVFDPDTGLLFFDLFNLDGILGDKFLVNGTTIQPFFEVQPRRYRFRWLNVGPSRFYQFFLTDPDQPGTPIAFWQISNDGNLLPRPVRVQSVRLGVAERADVIVDFSPLAGKTIHLENRLEQRTGRGPTGKILSAGAGDQVLEFRVGGTAVADDSQDPASITRFYDLPDTTETPRLTRTFRFERQDGQWAINQFEEHQILRRRSGALPAVETSRKDVVRLGPNEEMELFFRFRDFRGRYPLHCHNTVHEDHAMMLIWEIDDEGDDKAVPRSPALPGCQSTPAG